MSGAPDDDDFDFEDEDELPPEDEQDDDLPEDEDDEPPVEDDDDEPPEDDEPRARSRGESRAAKLARERNELRETNARLERELNARAAPVSPPAPQETQEQFQQRLNAMEPGDRALYLQQLQANHTNAEIAGMKFMLADQTDKVTFDSFANSNKAAKGLSAKVEQRLVEYRKQGVNIPRMDVLKHLLGERALEQGTRSRTRAERGAAERRERQSARPAGGRSDAPREDRGTEKGKAARDRRLENMKI